MSDLNFIKLNNVEEFCIDNKSVLFIIDMNNGFAKSGPLSSKRVEKLIPSIVEDVEIFNSFNNPIIAFTDSHKKECLEFKSYPIHCLENSYESEIVDEIKQFNDIMIIKKSSTNAFLEEETKKYIDSFVRDGYKNFVLCGCITEVCVKQFAQTLKAYLNVINKDINVIVPINSVDTYDSPEHNADIINLFSFYEMNSCGIKIVKNIIKK
ncbi:MAG: isochorismatase family cysteine hydrolase [Sarcina ventriculi]|uniref:isochorismatase family cysteine hydrolase n=1 Tax=Sarcina ventriculi TaxID=1267 RepID=UPI00073F76FA|nr:isochorismatase family cysteine hydrolase [Sarcina ventriculi]MCI5635364.1 cysteine hydrolase [Sarcina ventriculi]MDD7374273.1 cysteine hydrolase [Sarcina ventriculi]MDY7061954.1 isochorismatase family cysteine hydrolase [Sarcina ventriculi]